ncbi:TPA: hypothetical protein V1E37_000664 [Streptococcus pneumoniae]|nr:hypothetical protein [Streptococcus pneumoniae]HEW8816122.1 hypothetical protein [Streptococcus pneumoniae]
MLNENQEQTRKLTAGCSKHSLEVVDKTDEISSKHGFEVVDKAKLMWFEEIFEEIKNIGQLKSKSLTFSD